MIGIMTVSDHHSVTLKETDSHWYMVFSPCLKIRHGFQPEPRGGMPYSGHHENILSFENMTENVIYVILCDLHHVIICSDQTISTTF